MRLSELHPRLGSNLKWIPPVEAGGAVDPDLLRAVLDSRRVKPGDLFCALAGTQSDGRKFIQQAIDSGARAILLPQPVEKLKVPQLLADSNKGASFATGEAAAILAGNPSQEFPVLGVTGTNGKTTIAHLIQDAYSVLGFSVGRAGTLGFSFQNETQPLLNTTPPADELQEWLSHILKQGASAAVIEASSHGLHQGRLAGTRFATVGWSNLSHDHLDYHADMEAYAQAKSLIVHGLSTSSRAWIPAGNELIARACRGSACTLLRWSLEDTSADLFGSFQSTPDGLKLEISGVFGTHSFSSSLIGQHNAENLVLAFALLCEGGLKPKEAAMGLSRAGHVPGRLEKVAPESSKHLFVDYAHTPEALEKVLNSLRASFPESRIGVVFGAGGDRDTAKRAPMGRAASEGSDWCVVTSDNPRSEEPERIARMVAKGVRRDGGAVEIIVDRREAIRSAVARLGQGDVLLVAGKGHEDYQEIHGVRTPFDDCFELQEAVQCLV
ncbi:MAG: UDP-N-acetylmuramoyl-L-alanyl-D-glutamate--2,6-diaminopimelate ligase [Planctomycetota bacterium]|jgi:UDP-N-acetylmuramyl-tripeptide synthetase|nr:UDP-N-acetylmuramoyl-L-alanyl-D-glutamate--2,6-diaminopimelate ligase [Planctomycetota bacterium]MDP6942208.1 UDP-N-acetylmuramoyl-L-alanyl-D-glutamate--2,6-diaminopimelate ligase [Planctomycetota bacterium]